MSAHAVPVRSARPPAVLRLAQVLLALMSVVLLWGSIYFSAIAPPTEMGAIDWIVAAWAFAMGAVLLSAAVRLRSGDGRVHRLAVRVLVLHVVFGLVKLLGYGEPEALGIMAADGVLLGLLSLRRLRRWFS